MAPKVLVSDKLSETAVQIFRDRGIEVDFDPSLGKDKDKLLAVIVNMMVWPFVPPPKPQKKLSMQPSILK